MRASQEMSRFHVEGYRAMSALLAAVDRGATTGEDVAEMLRLRRYWPRPLPGDQVQTVSNVVAAPQVCAVATPSHVAV